MVINFVKKHFLRFIIFCLVGGGSALVHLSVFNLLRFFLGLSFFISVLSGVCVSIIFNFLMNRNFTFSARGQPIKTQIMKYAIIYATSIGVNLTVALFVESILGTGVINENIATISGVAVSIPISFFGSLLWVFRNN